MGEINHMLLLIAVLLLSVIAEVLIIHRICFLRRLMGSEKDFVVVDGVMDDVKLRVSGIGVRHVIRARYHFTMNGRTYHSRRVSPVSVMQTKLAGFIGTSVRFPEKGDTVDVIVNRNDPEWAYLDTRWRGGLRKELLGTVALAVAFPVVWGVVALIV